MKVRINLIAVFMAVLPAIGLADWGTRAETRVDESKPVAMTGHVAVKVVRGEVTFIGWDKPTVRVSGTLDTRTTEFVFDVKGDETFIEVKLDRGFGEWFGAGEGADLTIHVPTSSRVAFNGTSTNVDLTGLEKSVEVNVVSGDVHLVGGSGRVMLQSVSGGLYLKGSSGHVNAGTVSGDVEADAVTGEARYSTVSGDIVIEGGGKEIRLESVSGSLELKGGAVDSLSGHSVSGDILISTQLLDAGTIEFDNVSGSIKVQLVGKANARFDLETGSGTIRNKLSADKPVISKYMGDEHLRFTLGEGAGQVILSSRTGNLTVEPHR